MRNFRIRKDGALEKRWGYRFLMDLKAPITAIWTGSIEGKFRFYAVAGQKIFSLNVEDRTAKEIGTLSEDVTHVCFFYYQDTLFLVDGKHIWDIRQDVPMEVQGYAPLIGKDWNNRSVGEFHEKRNLLTRRARISYIISDPPSIFMSLDAPLESVDAVYVNDQEYSAENYYYDASFQTVNIMNLSAGDRVTIYITYAEGNDTLREQLLSSTRSVLYGGANQNRVFLWGDEKSGKIFCSSYVDRAKRKESARAYSDSCALYFPDGSEFSVGKGGERVCAAQPNYDCLMIFSENDVWIANDTSSGFDEFPTTLVNARLGCASIGGATLAENDVISVGDGTIRKWLAGSDRFLERNAVRISQAIDPLLSPEDFTTMGLYYDQRQNELWLNVRNRQEIWVYHMTYQQWVCFEKIDADEIFDVDGMTAFLKGSKIYVFDPQMMLDGVSDTELNPIVAEYISEITDFGTEARKNLSHLTMHADTDGDPILVTFVGNGTPSVSRQLSDPKHDHTIFQRRFPSGGFRHGYVQIQTAGNGRPTIHSLTLNTR